MARTTPSIVEMRGRDVGVAGREHRRQGRLRARHPDRIHDAGLHEPVPRHSGCGRHHFAGHLIHDVLVHETGSHRVGELEAADPLEDLARRQVAPHPQQVRPAEAAVVTEQVAHGELARHRRIGELEPGQVLGDLVIPRDLALVYQHGDGERRHRLGRGHHAEERLRVHGLGRTGSAHAEALGIDHGAVLHDRDRQARDFPVAHAPGDVGIQIGAEACAAGRLGQQRGGNEHGEEPQRGESTDPHAIPQSWNRAAAWLCRRTIRIIQREFG